MQAANFVPCTAFPTIMAVWFPPPRGAADEPPTGEPSVPETVCVVVAAVMVEEATLATAGEPPPPQPAASRPRPARPASAEALTLTRPLTD
jgi:hypothetical protein